MKSGFSSAFLLAASALFAAAQAPRPHILFILADDLGWGDLGVFYQNSRNFATNRATPAFATPNLDAIAASGLQLRRHYSPAPVCAPSRASLLLGVHQGHANVRDNQFDKALENNHTLASVLKQAGYATALIGKYGLQGSGLPAPARPELRGFDDFFGYLEHGDAHYHYPKESGANVYEGTTEITADLDKSYSTDLIAARAKKWIANHQETAPSQPFFLYLPFTAPHARLDVPTQAYPPGKGLSGGLQWTGTPGAVINTASGTINSWIHPDYENATYDDDNNPATAEIAWPAYAKRHATMIRRLDDAIADLDQTLADLGIRNNTLIVFTSDNGPHNEAGSGGSFAYNPTFFDSFGPLDGIKRDTWEGGIREPAIVRWPGHIAAGGISSNPSQFHDWLPTFAELAGVAIPARADGVSLVPTLTGTGVQKPGTIYVEYNFAGSTPSYAEFETSRRGATRNQEQVIHLEGYKGIRYNVTSAADDFQIYDTLNDPGETTNLAGSSAFFVGLQQRMKDRVLQVRRAGGGVSRPYDTALVPPAAPPAVVQGLDYSAYEKAAPWVPGWENETATATGTVGFPDLSVATRADDVGLSFTGYLFIPADGTYDFHLSTDTGAFVRLHDAQLIDADFGYSAGTEKASGGIPLKAGYHPIRIHYRRGSAALPHLDLQWSGPGIAKQSIPASAYFREGIPVPIPPSALPDNASTTGGNPVSIAVLANDTDDGTPAPLALVSVSQPQNGSAALDGSSVTYTPRAGFYGKDEFTYTITDGQSQASAPVRVEVFASNSDLWFPLDETSGVTASEAGGRPLGTLANFSSPGWTAGKLSGGLRFNSAATTEKVTLAGQKGVVGTAARTVAFWVNADADQGSGIRSTLISWGASNGSGTNNGRRFDINLNHSTGYRFRVEFNGGGVNFDSATISDPRGAGWVHVAIVVPTNGTIGSPVGYLNGQAATNVYEGGAASSTAINTGNTNDITFGNWATDASRPFRGILDDVRIYPRDLGAAEIATLAAISPTETAATIWHFRHTGNSAPTAADWSDDLDADGFSTTLEYALGGNPTSSSSSIAPRLGLENTFIFNRRRSGIPASAYVVEQSETLANWLPVIGSTMVVSHPELPEIDQVTVTPQPSASPEVFLRLRVDP
ncbi:MAG: sulfatase-like hydrolase/transferase [Luteolibacter sp.]|jgi:arylsulfatase A-like enzyme|nr:sulfatase-like hydrolase/transferase [Luteolibacter sp.]